MGFRLDDSGDAAGANLLYQKAAEKGFPRAQNSYAVKFATSKSEEDAGKEIHWFRQAADQGIAIAQCNLGIRYLDGIKTEKNDKEGLRYIKRSADQGYLTALNRLAFLYEFGRNGVSVDETEAAKLYKRSADFGDPYGAFGYGRMLRHGKGVDKNLPEASSYYRKAAGAGLAGAQYDLGQMFEKGLGVEKT